MVPEKHFHISLWMISSIQVKMRLDKYSTLPDIGDSGFFVPNSQDLIYPNLMESG